MLSLTDFRVLNEHLARYTAWHGKKYGEPDPAPRAQPAVRVGSHADSSGDSNDASTGRQQPMLTPRQQHAVKPQRHCTQSNLASREREPTQVPETDMVIQFDTTFAVGDLVTGPDGRLQSQEHTDPDGNVWQLQLFKDSQREFASILLHCKPAPQLPPGKSVDVKFDFVLFNNNTGQEVQFEPTSHHRFFRSEPYHTTLTPVTFP